jgi:acyl-coenzyme A thioesterase PaaI-like protein
MVTFEWAYQGPPGHVHGGFVAAMFDEALGLTQSLSGQPGMTGTLTVRYRKPTPLNTELRLEGRILRVEGRKIFTAAQLRAGETLTAEADAVFITVDLTAMQKVVRLPGPA